ncbi:MAG: hypothetical protein RIS06_683, partial [Actinomycetota bacterium]
SLNLARIKAQVKLTTNAPAAIIDIPLPLGGEGLLIS